MNLIQKLGLEKCKEMQLDILDTFDGDATGVTVRMSCGLRFGYEELSNAIANHGAPTNKGTTANSGAGFDHCSDIANHISPNTKVFER